MEVSWRCQDGYFSLQTLLGSHGLVWVWMSSMRVFSEKMVRDGGILIKCDISDDMLGSVVDGWIGIFDLGGKVFLKW